MDYKKGSKENPYSYDEYLELAAANMWMGGYVRISETRIKWIQEQEETGTEDSSGCGSGCGSDAGSGSGCGSNDKPKYMVRGGSMMVDVVGQLFEKALISWTDGIAIPISGCSGAAGTAGGFYSKPSITPYWATTGEVPSGFVMHEARAEFSAPYDIKTVLKCSCGPDNRTLEMTYTIPAIYHEDF